MNLIEKDLLEKSIVRAYGKALKREKNDNGKFIVYSQVERKYVSNEKEPELGAKRRADAYLFTSYLKAREIADKVGGKVIKV